MSEPSAVLRIVIASDNFLTREGLGCLLSGVRGIEIVARVDSHPETLAAVRQYRPDVLIVGIRTPRVNAEAALSAAQQLRSQYPNIGVVVIAEAGDGYALELLRSGAAGVGYLLDDRIGDLETLLSAVHGAHAGDTVLDPSIVNALVRRRCPRRSTRCQCGNSMFSQRWHAVTATMRSLGTLRCRRRPLRVTSPVYSASSGYPTPNASTAAWPRS